MAFFGLKLGLDLEMRAAHPHQKFQGVPPGNLYHFTIFFCLFFTKNLVEQLRERRDKLRERLKHGPDEIVQEYLKMGRCFSLYLLTSGTLSLHENLKC